MENSIVLLKVAVLFTLPLPLCDEKEYCDPEKGLFLSIYTTGLDWGSLPYPNL
jgi:hypothetical protein